MIDSKTGFVPYNREIFSEDEMLEKSKKYFSWMDTRRTVRDFSSKTFPREIIDNIVMAASTAPSGAHKQPWTFCVVSNPEMKKQIREAAEKEEYENYTRRMSEEWLKDLEPFATNHVKEFLEIAPYLIVVMKKSYDLDEEGTKHTNYYVNESVGLAAGFLLAAIHEAGLVALTHTPSPMIFLKRLLNRPKNEQPFLLIPVGLPVDNVEVPNLERKKIEEVIAYY